MILKVSHMKEGVAMPLEAAYDPRTLDLEFVDLRYLTPVALSATAERFASTVIFRGNLKSQVEQVCARCLERVPKDIFAPFDLSYDVNQLETLDTTDDLRDILLLDHPERFLCRNDCKGICPGCGANLNRETCHCNKSSVDVKVTPFEQLKSKFKKESHS